MDPLSTLSRFERIVLDAVKERGVRLLVAVVTAGSIVLSLTITSIALVVVGAGWAEVAYAIPIAVAVPSLVAPAVAFMLGRLLLALDEASGQLHRAARYDGLTGVLNRTGFDEAGEQLIARRRDEVLVVCMADVDDFKEVNDERGHAVGDTVLRGLAAALVEAVGDQGIIGRYGGDEFAVAALCPPGDAAPLVDRVRGACEPTGHHGGAWASIGSLVTASPVSLTDAISAADRAMYQAKRDRSRHHVGIDSIGAGDV